MCTSVLLLLGFATWALWPRDASLEGNAAAARGTADLPNAVRSVADGAVPAVSAHDRTVDAAPPTPPAASDDVSSPTRLRGRVERPDASPVAGAEVQLLRRDADAFWNLDLDYGRQIDTIASAHTDAAGNFAFDVARGVLYRLQAKAVGAAPVLKTGCAGGQFVVLTAAPGATLAGVVRSKSDHAPVADARVRLRHGDAELGETRTLRDGTFTVGELPAGKCSIRVLSKGLIELWQAVELAAGAVTNIDILLERGGGLHGTVSDAVSHAPVGDARVADSWTMANAVVTDAEGRFELLGIDNEAHAELYVHATGYAAVVRRASEAKDGVLDILLQRGGGVRGRLVDARQQPMARAYVAVGADFPVHPGIIHTDWLPAAIASDGTFTVSGLMPEHTYWLYARADGCGTRTWALPRPLPPGEWLDVGEVQLLAGAVVEGIARDPQGNPVVGMEVRLCGKNADWLRLCGAAPKAPNHEVSQFTMRDMDTDAAGRFRFAGVAAGTYEVTLSTSNSARDVKHGPFAVADGQVLDDIMLVFATGLSLAGHLRLPAGLPTDAHWTLYTAGNDASWSSVAADGAFRFENLEPGNHTIHLHDAPPGWGMPPAVDIAAGRSDLELTPIAAAAIRGRVVDAAGKPVRAQVYARAAGCGMFLRTVQTDAEGRFTIWVLPGAPVSVHVRLPDNPLLGQQLDNVLPGSEIELRLPK